MEDTLAGARFHYIYELKSLLVESVNHNPQPPEEAYVCEIITPLQRIYCGGRCDVEELEYVTGTILRAETPIRYLLDTGFYY